MRTGWLLLLSALLAGCTQAADDPELPVEPDQPSEPALPPDLQVSATMPASLSDQVGTGAPECDWPTLECQRHAFSLPRNATATIHLTWAPVPPATDLDMYLVPAGYDAPESQDWVSERSLSRDEFLRGGLPAGEYEVVVAGSTSTDTPYELNVYFDEPRVP